jgi:PAS domain S-box-containing protein
MPELIATRSRGIAGTLEDSSLADPAIAGHDDEYYRQVLNDLPAAIYTTDASGRITYYNHAAATLWGHRPILGESEWCGSWKLFWPDGRALPHGECPMAVAIKEKRPIRGVEAIAERPDGSRVPFMPYPTLLLNAFGDVIGAVNMLVDISDRKRAEEATRRMAAIVASSADAIIGKSLDGVISSWNRAAEDLFGYSADEMIGKPVSLLIPPDRRDEEPDILDRIRRGEAVEHYETVRQRKDGSLVDISLTVSPVLDDEGRVIGASKIARDISERRRAAQQQQLLLREMDHRVKNLFTLASGLVALSARSATSTRELVAAVQDRLAALANAHALTISPTTHPDARPQAGTTLHTLIRTITSPYEMRGDGATRVSISGPDLPLGGISVTSFALLLHEFATNAAKYGALSTAGGEVRISCREDVDRFELDWEETGGPKLTEAPDAEGFGGLITRSTIEKQLGGSLSYQWRSDGLVIQMVVRRDRLASLPTAVADQGTTPRMQRGAPCHGEA